MTNIIKYLTAPPILHYVKKEKQNKKKSINEFLRIFVLHFTVRSCDILSTYRPALYSRTSELRLNEAFTVKRYRGTKVTNSS